MHRDDTQHAACVDAWLRGAETPGATAFAAHFELALRALWGRAVRTLGEVTLGAIVDRVLYSACEKYPLLSAVKVDGAGIQLAASQEERAALPSTELVEAARFVLVEFLTVLGNLTAEILTPGLHAALRAIKETHERREDVTS
jgi:hypothetical protein